MKILILLLAVGIVAAEYKVKVWDDLTKYHDECGAKHHIPAKTLEKYKQRDYANDDISHCHIHCLAKKMGLWDDEHGFKVDNVVKQVSSEGHVTAEEVKPKIETCVEEIAQYKDDPCKWAFEGFKCGQKQHLDTVENDSLKSRFLEGLLGGGGGGDAGGGGGGGGGGIFQLIGNCAFCWLLG